MANFDPYLQWLGIRSPERPPNHYRLLGVEPFESDANVIETAADRQMAHVRTFQNGKDADLSQQILNELAAAKLCLLDGKSKFEYDTQLKERYFNDPPPVDPATIDIAPTSARVLDVADEPGVEISVEDDSFQLSRPKRGARGSRARIVLGGVIVALLAVGGAAYQFGPLSSWLSSEQVAEDPGQVEPNEAEPTEDGSKQANEPTEDQERDLLPLPTAKDPGAATPNRDDPANTPADSVPNDDIADDQPEAGPPENRVARVEQRPPIVRPSTDTTKATEPPSASTPWTQPREQRNPFRCQPDSPLEGFVMAIASRDLEAAQMVLDSHQSGSALGRNFARQLEPLVVSHEQFWQAVREAVKPLRLATQLQYRGTVVQVIGRKGDSIELKAANGDRQSFSTKQAVCDPDLAIALVLHRHRENPHVARRLAATFLAVDRDGDIDLAREYWTAVEMSGVAVAPDRRAFNFLFQAAGANVPKIVPKISDAELNGNDAVDDEVDVIIAAKEPRRPVPGKNALRAARRRISKDMAPFFGNKTEQGKELLVEELLNRATQNRLNPITAYAMLDWAKQIGSELERGDLVLRALVAISQHYDQDLPKAAAVELSSLKTGSQNKLVAESAVQLGDAMIREDEMQLADNLLELAQSRLQAAPDATLVVDQYRERLSQAKEIRSAGAMARRQLEEDSKDPEANYAVGVHYLVRQEFQEALTYLLRCGHAELQDLAMTDLTTAATSRPNMTLAAKWELLADEFDGLVKSSMLGRAKYWTGR